MGKKLTLLYCQNIAVERGGVCLSDEYIGNSEKMKWRCKEGHVWETSFSHIINKKTWCRKCQNNNRKITIEECQLFAQNKGGRCLSEEYINCMEKMSWSCKKEHVWITSFNQIKSKKTWCPECSRKKKITIEECQLFAQNKGGECLSEKYINNGTKMDWKCSKGHIWNACFSDIKNNKSWCVECYGNKKLTIEECQLFAQNKGGECLSEEYINSNAKMKWKCSENHIWDTTFNSIKNVKTWCPHCSKSRSEKLTRSIFEELTGLFFPSIRPDFLKNPQTNYNLELDGYCDDLKLAFEYQGIQHYEFVEHFHKTQEDFINRQKRDRLKLKLCKDHEISVILIPYTLNYQNESDLRVFIKDSLVAFGFE